MEFCLTAHYRQAATVRRRIDRFEARWGPLRAGGGALAAARPDHRRAHALGAGLAPEPLAVHERREVPPPASRSATPWLHATSPPWLQPACSNRWARSEAAIICRRRRSRLWSRRFGTRSRLGERWTLTAHRPRRPDTRLSGFSAPDSRVDFVPWVHNFAPENLRLGGSAARVRGWGGLRLGVRGGLARSGCRCRWWACQRLQWMQLPSAAAPVCHRLGRSGWRSRARAMATKANPSSRADCTVSSRLMPPEQDERHVEGFEEAASLGQEVGLLEGVSRA